MIVYGLISYIMLIALFVGYFIVKRWGDKQPQPKPRDAQNYAEFNEEGEESAEDKERKRVSIN